MSSWAALPRRPPQDDIAARCRRPRRSTLGRCSICQWELPTAGRADAASLPLARSAHTGVRHITMAAGVRLPPRSSTPRSSARPAYRRQCTASSRHLHEAPLSADDPRPAALLRNGVFRTGLLCGVRPARRAWHGPTRIQPRRLGQASDYPQLPITVLSAVP